MQSHNCHNHYCITARDSAQSISHFVPVLVWIVTLIIVGSNHAVTALFLTPSSTATITTATKNHVFLHHRHFRHHSSSTFLRRRSHLLLRMVANTDNNADDGAAAAALLEKEYEMMELMVTKRGEIEEVLMADSDMRPLLPNELATAAVGVGVGVGAGAGVGVGAGDGVPKQQQGFGGSSAKDRKKKKKKKSKKDAAPPEQLNSKLDEAKEHAKVLKNEGLVRIDGILSDSIADTLRDFVYNIRMVEGNKLKATTSMEDKFPTIRRWDLSIPLFEYDNSNSGTKTPTIAYQALNDILHTSIVGETMSRFLGTSDAELYELASYISDSGSSRQVVHSDTPCFGTDDNQPVLCTCFIALQDIRMDMGPTVWLPKTNICRIHDLFFGEEDAGKMNTPEKDYFLQTRSSVVGIIPKGSCVLFDSRLLHCGTANKSLNNESRALFFFSFRHPKVNLSNPGGDQPSIRSDLKGRFRLSDFVDANTDQVI